MILESVVPAAQSCKVIEATEAAIVAALLAAQTMTGRDGHTAHALDHDRLLEVMARFGRAPQPA